MSLSPRVRAGAILLAAFSIWALPDHGAAQTLIGSPGAGWQTWAPAADLNNNAAPYWDVPWGASGAYGGSQAEKNAGFCLTSSGDCQGIGSAHLAPGALPFWGMPYDASADTGGARDNKVYFRSHGQRLTATLELNASAVSTEINEFGWFETDATGSVLGHRHVLFKGTGEPPGTQTASAVGTTVSFTPSKYFGYYYSDVSEPATTPAPAHGCYAYTLFGLNEPRCLEASGGQGDHDMIVFSHNATAAHPTYWIVGEDPADCTSKDGDCNLTIVRVRQASH